MPSKYFAEFPKINVSNRDGILKEATDIFRRVRVREDFKELVSAYYTRDLTNAERPELLAYQEYGVSTLHWPLMLVNDIVNPYHEWVMIDKVLENFVATKYPDKYLVLADSHFDIVDAGSFVIGVKYTILSIGTTEFDLIGADNTPSVGEVFTATGTGTGTGTAIDNKLFLPNETITGSNLPAATGTIVNFDTTNNQIIYKSVSGTFEDAETITGGTSTITGTVNGTPGLEVDAIHHWEIQRDLADGTTERLVVAKTETRNLPNPLNNNTIETYVAVKVSNYEYEANRNDENRKVKLLDASYLNEFERDFKEKIKI